MRATTTTLGQTLLCGVVFAALSACATGPEKTDLSAQRSVFDSPYANQQIAQARVDPETGQPAYFICNGDRCAALNRQGDFIRMSREERLGWRARIRLAEQNRRQNEGIFLPEDPPETREPDSPLQSSEPPVAKRPE
ncbi:MAG: hypothetical protein WBA51_05755 [Erythrobacter sp.]